MYAGPGLPKHGSKAQIHTDGMGDDVVMREDCRSNREAVVS